MKQQGMTDREVMASATTVAARVLVRESRTGKLAPGFSAEIITADGNPLCDVTVWDNGNFVTVQGRIIDWRGTKCDGRILRLPSARFPRKLRRVGR